MRRWLLVLRQQLQLLLLKHSAAEPEAAPATADVAESQEPVGTPETPAVESKTEDPSAEPSKPEESTTVTTEEPDLKATPAEEGGEEA